MRSPVIWYRIARRLSRMKIPVLPRFIDYFVRLVYGCWLPHTATIGDQLELGYGGLGCVIHSDCKIGNGVHIGSGVVLGGSARREGQPILGDNVYVGAGAKLLGPIRIGDGAVIGANAVVLRDVPNGALAVGVPARVVKKEEKTEGNSVDVRD